LTSSDVFKTNKILTF